MLNEFSLLSASSLVAGLHRRDFSSHELCEHYLEVIEATKQLNVVVHTNPDDVLAAAEEADRALARGERGRLLGLPVSIKDSIAVAGWPARSGSRAREHHVPNIDATAVKRIRNAGGIILCKTAVPEYTWSTETDSHIHGRSLNPYDLARTPGGSSGGEAALHAVGGAPLGVGSDGLNSIRVPAHYCGTVGLQPTAGLVPESGVWPSTRDTGMLDFSTLGPMGRFVDDLELMLGVIAGPDYLDPYSCVEFHYLETMPRPKVLTVGWWAQAPGFPVTPGTAAAVAEGAELLKSGGHNVEQIEPWSLTGVVELAFSMMGADGGAQARADLSGARALHSEQMSSLLFELAQIKLTAGDFLGLMSKSHEVRTRIRRELSKYDVVLTPVCAGPAPLHGCRPIDGCSPQSYDDFAHAFLIAIAGVPSVSVPVTSELGLPVGIQVISSPYRDLTALDAARAIEASRHPFAKNRIQV
jgi:amidase